MLSATKVNNAKPQKKDYMIADRDGLYLRVRKSGSKVFVVRKTRHRKPSLITLGAAGKGGLSLADARAKVQELNSSRRAWSKMPFADLLEEWFDECIEGTYKRPHHVRGYINNVSPELANLRLIDIERADITRFLKQHKKKSGPVGANRFLAILKQVFIYAVDMGYMSASPINDVSRKSIGGVEKPRDRVLTDDEIRQLWHVESSNAPLLRFLLLTGQRISEAQNAKWSDIEGDVWRIDENKSNREHFCILAPQALAIINDLPRVEGSDMIFHHKGTQFPATAVQAWLKRWQEKHGIEPRYTPHDLRRTMRTRLGELGVDFVVAEKILNHVLPGVMQTYDRSVNEDERRIAMCKWANKLDEIVA